MTGWEIACVIMIVIIVLVLVWWIEVGSAKRHMKQAMRETAREMGGYPGNWPPPPPRMPKVTAPAVLCSQRSAAVKPGQCVYGHSTKPGTCRGQCLFGGAPGTNSAGPGGPSSCGGDCGRCGKAPPGMGPR